MINMDFSQHSENELRAIDIHELLPQRVPFVMVGKLVHFDERLTITETVISEDNMFVENGRFIAEGLIENIAQTCAARIGYINKFIFKKGVQIGYIGAIRNMDIVSTPKVGQKITTRMEVLEDIFDIILARVDVECERTTIATTEMKIAIKKGG